MRSLVDADSLVYLAGFIGEKTHYEAVVESDTGELGVAQFSSAKEMQTSGGKILDYHTWKELKPLSFSLSVVKDKLQFIADKYSCVPEIYIKGDNQYNFRDKYATLAVYKANRVNTAKPEYYDDIRSYLRDRWGAIQVQSQEVDDEIGCRLTELAGQKVVICSPDKDLDQFPGLHWNYRSNVEYEMTPEDAQNWFWQQVLSGDPSDNIKGCYKVGEAGAQKIIEELDPLLTPHEVWAEVVRQYVMSTEKQGCPYEDLDPYEVALENARLVYMRRERYEIWNPPGTPKEYDYPGVEQDD